MVKILMILFLTCVSIKNYAQILPHKTPSQNKHWLDSMKRIINKGFELNTQDKNNWKKQLTYVNTCTNLGRYYEWAYDKHYVKNMAPALKYYKKVINISYVPYSIYKTKILAISTSIYRKLADIYFIGKGVEKNKKESLELALHGVGRNMTLVNFYTKRYYGNKKKTYLVQTNDILRDSIFTFKASRFTTKEELFDFKIIEKELKKISDIFKEKEKKDSVELLIECYCEPNPISTEFGSFITKKIFILCLEKYNINPDLINTNTEIGVADDIILKIFIKKKPLPVTPL